MVVENYKKYEEIVILWKKVARIMLKNKQLNGYLVIFLTLKLIREFSPENLLQTKLLTCRIFRHL